MFDFNRLISGNQSQAELITNIAKERAENYGELYAKSQAPISPKPELSGNHYPEKSLLSWLRGVNKCNQFVGDVLTKAGFEMPTFKMKDGSEHYMNAEKLPKQRKYFDLVCDLGELKQGDIVVLDDRIRRGESGAHVEFVSFSDNVNKILKLIGARKDGAKERTSKLLSDLELSGCTFLRKSKQEIVYFLRPKKFI